MKTRDKEIRDLVIKVRGYYDGIDERLTDALKGILRRLDKPDHIPDAGKKVDSSELNWFDEESRKSFNAREEKLRADSTWPNTNWYRDDEFCKMYREACDRLEAANKRAEKSEFNPRLNMAFPVEWIGQYRNGGCTDPCDMISGPCACGATHHFDEWIIKRKKLVQGKGWVNPEESQEPAEALLVEIWECRVCHEKAPCRVVIVYSENTVTKSFKGNLRFRNKVCICRESHFPEWKLLAEPESQEPAEPVSELTDADVISIYEAQCWPANENKIKEWKKWGKDMCVRLEAANKRADEAERKENSSQAMIKRLRKAIKQLTIQLEAAKCVNEMLKEKGIG